MENKNDNKNDSKVEVTLNITGLTAEQEDIMIESQLEMLRSKRMLTFKQLQNKYRMAVLSHYKN